MVATPPDEIARQHQEAIELLDQQEPVARVDYGEIPLSQKQQPTHTDDDDVNQQEEEQDEEKKSDGNAVWCVSSRGQVDIGPLQRLILEGYDTKKQVAVIQNNNNNNSSSKTTSNSKKTSSKQTLSTNNTKKATTTKKKTKQKSYSKTNLWDETNASENNVAVTRPSHDNWGIKKVVLVFCDDFLRDVYEMPWWHLRPDMQQAVRPVLDCLGIPPRRVVRLLLAALPPGTTIPIHHDTGEWVKHTHRIHTPVVVTDPTRVLFRCGPNPHTLQRIDCTPGHVFEMNNQAKHAVSNCGTHHRVHLILDYVDEEEATSPPPHRRRIQLAPGERLVQTRRSIDRLVDRGTRPTPSYLILGAQKAGTTSLYEYMVQHPWVVRARRRETHCLDWRWNDQLATVSQRRAHCHKFFYTSELELHPSCLTGDSTPSYLLDSKRVIPRIHQVFAHPLKFLVMVRDPVRRAHSHYAMVTSTVGTPAQLQTRGTEWRQQSLVQVIQQELRVMDACGLIPYWNIETGQCNESVFLDFGGSVREDEAWDRFLTDHVPLHTGSHSLLARGLYELQLRPWLRAFDAQDFLVLRMEDWRKDGGIGPTMDRVWRHLNLPPYTVQDESAHNTREYQPMPRRVQQYLERFYEPHNRRFGQLVAKLNQHNNKNKNNCGNDDDVDECVWKYNCSNPEPLE